MNLAAIDIGTNSTRLLISSCENGSYKMLIRRMEITRLGKSIKGSGFISEENKLLTLKVLKEYKSLIDKYGVADYLAIGTSALRRAVNRNEFVEKVFISTGMNIEIINGLKEADLSYNGAVRSLEISGAVEIPSKVLVIDVGGGSSEFILGDRNSGILLAESVDIGCVRISEEFLKSDPPGKNEILLMEKSIRQKIQDSLASFKEYGDFMIIGLAGTVSALAAILLGLEKYDMGKINYFSLDLAGIKSVYNNLCSISINERKKVAGLDPGRADIIIGGIAIVIEILKYFSKEKIIVSENDILDGIIYSLSIF